VRPKQKGVNQRIDPRCCLTLIPMRVRLRELLTLAVAQEIRRHDTVLVPKVLKLRPLGNAVTTRIASQRSELQ
jgi:hypothetical protein